MTKQQLKEKLYNLLDDLVANHHHIDVTYEEIIKLLDSSLSEIEEEIIKQPIRISDFNDPNCNDAFNQGGEEFKDTALQIIRERKME